MKCIVLPDCLSVFLPVVSWCRAQSDWVAPESGDARLSLQDARLPCWSPSCWWLPMLSHHYEEAFLGFNSKAVMVSRIFQAGREGTLCYIVLSLAFLA